MSVRASHKAYFFFCSSLIRHVYCKYSERKRIYVHCIKKTLPHIANGVSLCQILFQSIVGSFICRLYVVIQGFHILADSHCTDLSRFQSMAIYSIEVLRFSMVQVFLMILSRKCTTHNTFKMLYRRIINL